jgi:hypothetical protein
MSGFYIGLGNAIANHEVTPFATALSYMEAPT